eukprot:CAMPEP_0170523284 /NCGR_PEP_ID=MMETSP0209-20121228/8716_1 /TAXON_ID=665100 ORGANISM="Litonotus pictus, Strain P1" /NCGR_SAMPLE_ID=MMETSP0209 /ASSEMBLY_ACC=CAM_ASM_000301 /LENGTH=716 /DNA_ID=CAMNT_0010811301 /DNA_START=84 /DNA_END=2234 /DNA_ORIENTATION=+
MADKETKEDENSQASSLSYYEICRSDSKEGDKKNSTMYSCDSQSLDNKKGQEKESHKVHQLSHGNGSRGLNKTNYTNNQNTISGESLQESDQDSKKQVDKEGKETDKKILDEPSEDDLSILLDKFVQTPDLFLENDDNIEQSLTKDVNSKFKENKHTESSLNLSSETSKTINCSNLYNPYGQNQVFSSNYSNQKLPQPLYSNQTQQTYYNYNNYTSMSPHPVVQQPVYQHNQYQYQTKPQMPMYNPNIKQYPYYQQYPQVNLQPNQYQNNFNQFPSNVVMNQMNPSFQNPNSGIFAMNNNDFYLYSITDYGKNMLVALITSDVANLSRKKDQSSKTSVVAKLFFEKLKDYIQFLIINKNGSDLLVKMIRHLNFMERLLIWQVIKQSNPLKLSTALISSNVVINLINSLNDKAEEQFITKIFSVNYCESQTVTNSISSNSNTWITSLPQLNENLKYLSTCNSYTATVFQSILGRFTFVSSGVFIEFVLSNVSFLLSSPTGKLILEKYITVYRGQEMEKKKKLIGMIIDSLDKAMMNEETIDIILHLSEDWGTDLAAEILVFALNNQKIYSTRNYIEKSDRKKKNEVIGVTTGMVGLLSKLFYNSNTKTAHKSALTILYNLPDYNEAFLSLHTPYSSLIKKAISLIKDTEKDSYMDFIFSRLGVDVKSMHSIEKYFFSSEEKVCKEKKKEKCKPQPIMSQDLQEPRKKKTNKRRDKDY